MRALRFKPLVGFIALLVACLFWTVVKAEEPTWHSAEDFGRWMTNYYRVPEPGRVLEAFKYSCAPSGVNQLNEGGQLLVAAFFAPLFRQSDVLMERAWDEVATPGSQDSRSCVATVLSLVDSPRSRELLERAVTQWGVQPARQFPPMEGMTVDIPTDLFAAPIRHPAHLDMLWADFFATGESAPIKKILSALALQDSGESPGVVLSEVAEWSLTSNSLQHERVDQICRAELAHSEGTTRRLLERIVENVNRERIYPGSWRSPRDVSPELFEMFHGRPGPMKVVDLGILVSGVAFLSYLFGVVRCASLRRFWVSLALVGLTMLAGLGALAHRIAVTAYFRDVDRGIMPYYSILLDLGFFSALFWCLTPLSVLVACLVSKRPIKMTTVFIVLCAASILLRIVGR